MSMGNDRNMIIWKSIYFSLVFDVIICTELPFYNVHLIWDIGFNIRLPRKNIMLKQKITIQKHTC